MFGLPGIELRIFLFRSLVILKRHPSEKGWWYFLSRKKYKLGLSLSSFIHGWKDHFFFVRASLPWDFRTSWECSNIKHNSNTEILPRDEVADLALITTKVPKLFKLVDDQILFDTNICLYSHQDKIDVFFFAFLFSSCIIILFLNV